MSSLPNVASSIPGSGNPPLDQLGVDGQQDVGQTYDPSVHVLVEREKLNNVDVNNFIHNGQQYGEYQQNGVGELATYLDTQGISAFEIKRILENQSADSGDGQPAPVQDQPEPTPVTQAPAQQAMSPEQVQAMVQQGIQGYASKQASDTAYADEAKFMGSAMDELGLKGNADRDWQVKPQLEALVRRNREQTVHASNPNRQSLINAPYSQAEITAASVELKPHLAAQAQASLEQQADTQAAQNLPAGSLDGQGVGGRSQVPTDQMSREQKIELAEKRYEQTHGVKPL